VSEREHLWHIKIDEQHVSYQVTWQKVQYGSDRFERTERKLTKKIKIMSWEASASLHLLSLRESKVMGE
jgi:hypothetical protein